ncbi:hypothetical protein [Cytophaga aurantiaca]|uniref:hypothetical protein n=1 Tax=Cytophaga aurantiaca TaxID=29530 RepID=UPI000369CC06|nr:hypothetical protein [Cytophaga aurantiaca]
MGKANHKKDKEKAFRFASTIFLFAAAVAIIWAVGCFENEDTTLGVPLLITGFVLIGIMIWTFYHPFYPVLLGLIILIGLVTMLYQKADKSTFNLMGRYLFAGIAATGYALVVGFKDWRLKNKEHKNNIE